MCCFSFSGRLAEKQRMGVRSFWSVESALAPLRSSHETMEAFPTATAV